MPNIDLSSVTHNQRAQIMREERDALVIAWQKGAVRDLLDTKYFLNDRIRVFVDTTTGDTTE